MKKLIAAIALSLAIPAAAFAGDPPKTDPAAKPADQPADGKAKEEKGAKKEHKKAGEKAGDKAAPAGDAKKPEEGKK